MKALWPAKRTQNLKVTASVFISGLFSSCPNLINFLVYICIYFLVDMAILDKVISNSFICGIDVCFDGSISPSTIAGWQPFSNTIIENGNFDKLYATFPSVNFAEESEPSAAGTIYNQKVVFSFPEKDAQRSERIALLHQLKFIRLYFTDGLVLLVGRNDFNQNASPKIKYASNGNNAQFEVSCESMLPCGFTPRPNAFGLPTLIPFSLIS